MAEVVGDEGLFDEWKEEMEMMAGRIKVCCCWGGWGGYICVWVWGVVVWCMGVLCSQGVVCFPYYLNTFPCSIHFLPISYTHTQKLKRNKY